MLAWTAWIVSTLFILLVTYLVYQYVRGELSSLNLVVFLFLWIFFTTVFMLLTGLLGLLTPGILLVISALGLIPFGLFDPGRRLVLEFLAEARALWQQLSSWWSGLPRWLQWFTVLFGFFSLIRFTFLILVLPPFVWDSLTYHLTNVAEWVQRGKIELFATSMARIYTPANYEVFTLWFTVFLHHDVIVEAAGLPAYLLAILAVYVIARLMGASRAAAWFGSLNYATMPALLLATTGTKNDPHMAAYYLAALALIVSLLRNRQGIAPRNTAGQLILVLVVLLYAFGTKAYLVHIALGFSVLLVLGVDKGHGWRQWLPLWRAALQNVRELGRKGRFILFNLLVLGLFLGLYWNVRNWILQGNPFYPYGVQIESEQVLSGADRDANLSLVRFFENIDSLLDKFGDKNSRIVPDLDSTTGWGWFVYSLGIPALIMSVLRKREYRVITLTLFLSLGVILFSIRPSPWNMRYLLWFPALFSLAFAWLLDELLKADHSFPRIAVRLLAILAMSLNFIAMLNYGRIPPERFQDMLAMPLFERDAGSLWVNTPGEYENSLKIVPEEALLGYNIHSNGFIYPLYRANYAQHLVYIPIDIQGTCFDVAQAMRTRSTRYLFVAPEHTSDAVMGFLNTCGEAEIALRERTGNLYVLKD